MEFKAPDWFIAICVLALIFISSILSFFLCILGSIVLGQQNIEKNYISYITKDEVLLDGYNNLIVISDTEIHRFKINSINRIKKELPYYVIIINTNNRMLFPYEIYKIQTVDLYVENLSEIPKIKFVRTFMRDDLDILYYQDYHIPTKNCLRHIEQVYIGKNNDEYYYGIYNEIVKNNQIRVPDSHQFGPYTKKEAEAIAKSGRPFDVNSEQRLVEEQRVAWKNLFDEINRNGL